MSIQSNQEEIEPFTLGSSVYGGRPTFALVREENSSESKLRLYELLPTEQANARCRRIERHQQQASKVESFKNVIQEDTTGYREWTWNDWAAVKICQLSGVKIRTIIQLIKSTLRGTDTDPSEVTSTGGSSLLLSEATGVRLSLGFVGIKPLKRVDRMRTLIRNLEKISLEECYYWYAKCRSPHFPNGAKAMRTLLKE